MSPLTKGVVGDAAGDAAAVDDGGGGDGEWDDGWRRGWPLPPPGMATLRQRQPPPTWSSVPPTENRAGDTYSSPRRRRHSCWWWQRSCGRRQLSNRRKLYCLSSYRAVPQHSRSSQVIQICDLRGFRRVSRVKTGTVIYTSFTLAERMALPIPGSTIAFPDYYAH